MPCYLAHVEHAATCHQYAGLASAWDLQQRDVAVRPQPGGGGGRDHTVAATYAVPGLWGRFLRVPA